MAWDCFQVKPFGGCLTRLRWVDTMQEQPSEISVVDRTALLMSFLNKDMRIVEIGPSYNPIVPKSQGWQTTIVDHTDRAGLRSIYSAQGVPASQIEEVDVIWSSGALSDAFPREILGTFDVVLASHVIEHSPDIVRFLTSCRALLNDRGFVLLVVPDKRECFDYFKANSHSGEALEAYAERRTRHLAKTHFHHVGWAVKTPEGIAWGKAPPAGLTLVHRLHEAKSIFDNINVRVDGSYIDCHAWIFTPASFELLMLDLAALGLVDLTIDHISPALRSEFVVRLLPSRGVTETPEGLAARRLALMKRELLDARLQIVRLIKAVSGG